VEDWRGVERGGGVFGGSAPDDSVASVKAVLAVDWGGSSSGGKVSGSLATGRLPVRSPGSSPSS